jgi:hypothetical protein
MIEIKEIQLDITLPDDGIGMVIMQPFVELCGHEPYHWQNDKKDKQIERIVRTLEIAKQSDHGCEKTHFTIFPEYSIPGLEGVKKIQEILESNSWKKGTIVIGGIDGLTKNEYLTLISEDITKVYEENEPEKFRENHWLNCCVIWTKQTNGTVKKWVQSKLVPATQEELCPAYHMLTGKVVYIFKPSISIQDSKLPFRFLCFICKDWIGNIGGSSVVNMVLSQLSEQRRDKGIDDRLDIYLCIVLQRNPKPDYPLFLQSTVEYLKENWCLNIRRSDGAVLFVNNAGSNSAGHCKEFGKSGFIFPPNCSLVSHKEYCPPTYTLKNRDGITSCKEARFRESGACIVSFKFTPPIPAIFRRSPETPRIPMNPAIVHSIDAIAKMVEEDPRTPGQEVPASIKWVNDCLDGIKHLFEYEREHLLFNEIRTTHHAACKEIRKGNNEFLCKYITMASCEIKKDKDKWIEIGERKIHNVDNWDENEKQNLETVVHSISIMKVCKPLEIKGSLAHGTIKVQDKVIDVIIVSGKTHEECFKYAKDIYPGSGQRFVIVITRDIHNISWNKKFKSIIEDVETNFEKDPNITDPESRFYQCGYHDLVDGCFYSKNLEELKVKVTEITGV